MSYLLGLPFVWMSFKLKLVEVQPILDPLFFSHKFGKFVGIVDSLDEGYKKNGMKSLKNG